MNGAKQIMPDLHAAHREPDPTLLAPMLEATHYPFWDEAKGLNLDWPGNILSRRTVIYGDGTIARRDDPVRFTSDEDELALCRDLASHAAVLAEGLDVGGAGDNAFGPFYSVAPDGFSNGGRLDAEMIGRRFNGTIFPWAEIEIEPMAESGTWWAQKLEGSEDEDDDDDPYLDKWRALIRWFQGRPEFVDSAYVRIGDNLEMAALPPDAPEDVETVGVIMPRLIVGLTSKGSLVGLSGCAVLA